MLNPWELLELHPSAVLELIIPEINNKGPSGGFPWDMLASMSRNKSILLASSDLSLSLQWAEIAVKCYDWLLVSAAGYNIHKFEQDAMSLRLALIRKIGPRAGSPFLDPSVVEEWFFLRNTFTLDVVLSATFKDSDLFWSNEYNYLHSRLHTILPFINSGLFKRQQELVKWKLAFEQNHGPQLD